MQTRCDNLIKSLKDFYPQLGDIRLKNAVYKNGVVEVTFVSDVTVLDEDKNLIKSAIEREVNGIEIIVKTIKSFADCDIAKRAIFSFLESNCFSVAHAISLDSVKIICANKKIKYEILVVDTIADYLNRTSIIENINSVLEREYSNDFEGEVRVSKIDDEAPIYEEQSASENDIIDLKIRTVKMCGVEKFLDDEMYDTATYIADGDNILGKCYFAGTVIEFEEKQSKKGNTYYRITLDDKSGKISGSFFTSDKNKLQKLQKVAVGSIVIVRGDMELFNDRPSFLIKGMHFCEFPPNYKPERRASKKPPEKYTFAFPTPCETSRQDDFFTTQSKLPESFTKNEYVVVDIETTGTDVTSDKITEIGAVRIKNGVIVESFQTLIDPEVALSKKIIELTGITDDMLKGQPKIHEVYPDFIKFLGDSIFVAHNADFDYRFLRNVGKDLGYYIENECVDTLIVSRKTVPFLSNHKLNTVCEHFGIEFRHHRALSDAFATAEALIELVKIKPL